MKLLEHYLQKDRITSLQLMQEERDAEREKLWEKYNPWKDGGDEPNVIKSYLDNPDFARTFLKDLYDLRVLTKFEPMMNKVDALIER